MRGLMVAGDQFHRQPRSGDLALIAKSHVSRLFEHIGFPAEPELRGIDLRPFAKLLSVRKVAQKETQVRTSSVQPHGALYERPTTLFGDAVAEIPAGGFGARYAFAHELAHRMADLYLEPSQKESWGPTDSWRFLNHAASYLLVPDCLLRALSRDDWPDHFTIDWIESTHRKLRVPISCLLKRLDEAEREGILTARNCAALIVPDVSAKQRANYAPRVLVSCVPHLWYLPANKRLSSLGLQHLPRLFWSADPFRERSAEDKIALWERKGWRAVSLLCTFRYKIYETRPGTSRVMLTVFSPQESAN